MSLRLYSDRVVLGGGDEPLEVVPAEVVVRGGRIEAVNRVARDRLAADPERLDLGDKLVSPAFVNGHVHLALGALRGVGGVAAMGGNIVEDLWFGIESRLTPEDVRAFTRMGALEGLLVGTGAVFDHYYHGLAVAEGLRDAGLTGVVAPTLQDLSGPGATSWEAQLQATVDLAESAAFAEAGIVPALGQHATDTVSDALWARSLLVAESHHLPVHVHVAQSREEWDRALASGARSPIDRLARAGLLDRDVKALLVHGLYVSGADLARLDGQKHILGYCPFSQLQFGYPSHLPSWVRAGVPVLVGTDCAASNDAANVQHELRIAGGVGALSTTYGRAHTRFRATGADADAQAVAEDRAQAFRERAPHVTPAPMLAMAWSIPGGWHARFPVGRIAPGCLANLAVWEVDHPSFWPGLDLPRALAFGDTQGALWGLLVAGQWTGTPGDHAGSILRSPLWHASRQEAQARLSELFRRTGLVAPA